MMPGSTRSWWRSGRIELADVPEVAKGTALVLIIAGSLSLAFMGFAGLLSSS